MHNPIIVALDGKTREESLALAEQLKDVVWGFKVNDLYFELGLAIVEELGKISRVMLDAKLYDIPNTVGNVAKRFSRAPVDIMTVHATGGVRMMQAAVAHMPGKVAAVTALTSFSETECARSYNGQGPTGVAIDGAKMAAEAAAAFIVCSGEELDHPHMQPDKYKWGSKLKKIVPGIRPAWFQQENEDQRRVITPAEAIEKGAHFLVMGRPILKAADPVEAAQRTLEEI